MSEFQDEQSTKDRRLLHVALRLGALGIGGCLLCWGLIVLGALLSDVVGVLDLDRPWVMHVGRVMAWVSGFGFLAAGVAVAMLQLPAIWRAVRDSHWQE